ncbi:hypothetical protein HDE_12603 [Halotydeus destructor]|nr:hypothetical protein HDE_12603 [Halotydeus destructor]
MKLFANLSDVKPAKSTNQISSEAPQFVNIAINGEEDSVPNDKNYNRQIFMSLLFIACLGLLTITAYVCGTLYVSYCHDLINGGRDELLDSLETKDEHDLLF